MQRSININHDENKILSTFDNKFFAKEKLNWIEKENNIYKGYDAPYESVGDENDYYIRYDKISNYIIESENFLNYWNNYNNTIRTDTLVYPNSNCKKIIPNNQNTQHYISYSFTNDNTDYWCFSLYVRDVEFNNFRLSLLDDANKNGISATFTIAMNTENDYITTKKIEKIGNMSYNDIVFDEDCCDIKKVENGFYRVYVSGKILGISELKCVFTILKASMGELIDVFSNETSTSGILINSAQLSRSKYPEEYIKTDGNIIILDKFNSLYRKDNAWKLLENATIYYGNDIPSKSLGLNNDLYFVNPIIKLGDTVRFSRTNDIREPGLVFWNREKHTYSYVSNDGNIYDLSLSQPSNNQMIYSMLLSTNLFNQTYTARYTTNFPKMEFGYNSGGHGNFWDYNRLRRYY